MRFHINAYLLWVGLCLSIGTAGAQFPEVKVVGGNGGSGDQVLVSVDLNSREGITGVSFSVEYDAHILTLEEHRRGELGSVFSQYLPNARTPGLFRAVIGSGTPVAQSEGTLVQLLFRIAGDADTAISTLVLSKVQITDAQGNLLESTSTNGQIDIQSTASPPAPDETEDENPILRVVGGKGRSGENVDVVVEAAGIEDKVTGVRFTLEYDTRLLELISQERGDLGSQFDFSQVNGQKPGKFTVILGSAEPPPQNEGGLWELSFHVVDDAPSGETILSLAGVQLTDVQGNLLTADMETGRIDIEKPVEPPADIVSPIITSGPSVVDITETSAAIVWATDEDGSAVVEYGTTSGYGLSATGPEGTEHRVELTGLTTGTAEMT